MSTPSGLVDYAVRLILSLAADTAGKSDRPVSSSETTAADLAQPPALPASWRAGRVERSRTESSDRSDSGLPLRRRISQGLAAELATRRAQRRDRPKKSRVCAGTTASHPSCGHSAPVRCRTRRWFPFRSAWLRHSSVPASTSTAPCLSSLMKGRDVRVTHPLAEDEAFFCARSADDYDITGRDNLPACRKCPSFEIGTAFFAGEGTGAASCPRKAALPREEMHVAAIVMVSALRRIYKAVQPIYAMGHQVPRGGLQRLRSPRLRSRCTSSGEVLWNITAIALRSARLGGSSSMHRYGRSLIRRGDQSRGARAGIGHEQIVSVDPRDHRAFRLISPCWHPWL